MIARWQGGFRSRPRIAAVRALRAAAADARPTMRSEVRRRREEQDIEDRQRTCPHPDGALFGDRLYGTNLDCMACGAMLRGQYGWYSPADQIPVERRRQLDEWLQQQAVRRPA